jgi:hypothetical protein
MQRDPSLPTDPRLLRQLRRFKWLLKPDVSLTDVRLSKDGHLEARVCLPDGRSAPVEFVELGRRRERRERRGRRECE